MAEARKVIGLPTTYDETQLLPTSEKEGWQLGLVGIPWPGPWPKHHGDLFVRTPKGEQAGLAWEVDGPALVRISSPSEGRWGVFQLRFSIPVMSTDDLVRNFHAVLPLLKAEYAAYRAANETAAD